MSIDLATHRAQATRVRNTQVIDGLVVSWLFVCLCVAFFNRDFLPAKYFYDSGHIASLFGQFKGLIYGDSYNNTALFYDLTLLAGNIHVTALITSIVFNMFVFKCFTAPERMNVPAVHNLAIFCFSCVTGSIYLAQYSKESIVMLIVFLFFGLSNNRKQQVLWIIIAAFYAAYFRTYWFLVIAFYIYYSVLFKVSKNTFFIILGIVVAFLLLAIAFQFVLGVDLAYYRYSVNDERVYNQDAVTMIDPVLPTGNFVLEWINAVIQFFLMFFPFPLLTGNPLYLIFFLVTASLGIRLFFVIRTSIAARRLSQPTRENRFIALTLAFITIQSIFEPDYGSYIKHLTPMLPLILYFLCWHQKWRADRRMHYV